MTKYGTGRIGEIINHLKSKYNVEDVSDLDEQIKLNTLLDALKLSLSEFDKVIALNSPVFRTVKGHAFESVFKYVLEENDIEVDHIGGDKVVDLKVNGYRLQLKTPNMAGTKGNFVQYKTHKTHGAKSERESMNYYHHIDEFPNYLVGLVSYEPFKVIFLDHNEIPRHPKDNQRIQSPFTIRWDLHPGLNSFSRINVPKLDLSSNSHIPKNPNVELLPLSSKKLNLKSEIIVDTILNEGNFRIWDMSIRGFSREVAFKNLLNQYSIKTLDPTTLNKERGDKADFAVSTSSGFKYFQVKGISTNNCKFDGDNSTVATETQLTRGRVNDHPTQSRLYLRADFEYLILVLDPPQTALFEQEIGNEPILEWKVFCIPTVNLTSHSTMSHRLNSLQRLNYNDLKNHELDSTIVKKVFG